MFTMGFAAITVSLCRFVVLWQLSTTTDMSYIFGSVTIVTSLEFDTAIVTANAPGIAMFWKACVLRQPLGTSSASRDTFTPSSSHGLNMGNLSHIGGPGKDRSRRKSTARNGPTWLDDGGSEEELRPLPFQSDDGKKISTDGNSDHEATADGMKVDRRVTIRSERVDDDRLKHQRSIRSPREYYEFGAK